MNTAQPPLSHHDILRVSAPFVQHGLTVDLAASDRSARRIAFTAPAAGSATDAQTEAGIELRYDLYLLSPDAPVLIRIATFDGTLQATVSCQGEDLQAMLAAVATVTPSSQFRAAGQATVADSFDIDPQPGAVPRLTACAAQVAGLIIETDARTVVGEPMETTLRALNPDAQWQLPDDLLSLAHPGWRPLTETDEGWRTTLKVPVREPARSRETQKRFARMVDAVSSVLSQPPERYHRDHRARRWRIYGRRFIPAGVCVAIVGALPLLDRFVLGDGAQMHPGFLSLPPVLMIGALVLTWRDTPRIEIPPRPVPLDDTAWPVPTSPTTFRR